MSIKGKVFLLILSSVILLPFLSTGNDIKSDQTLSSKEFFLESEGLELWRVCNEISLFFGKNILVYPDVKDNKIYCNIRSSSFENVLELVSWLSGVEYYEKGGGWFFGGNSDYIQVLPNNGIDKAVEALFSGAVRVIEDKIIVKGTERDVNRISKAIEEMKRKESVTVRLWGYEVSEEKMLQLGIDIDKALEYSFSWEGLIQHSFNPIQNWVMSLEASLQYDASADDLRLVLDTLVTSMSGKAQNITVGEAVDRVVYTQNTETGNTVVSGYQTLQTGYVLTLKPYMNSENWVYDVSIENSIEFSEDSLRRNRLALTNTVFVTDSPVLIGRIIKEQETVSYKKGIPFLCDLPWIGYLFRVTTERKITRNVLFFMQKVEMPEGSVTSQVPQSLSIPLLDGSGVVKNLY